MSIVTRFAPSPTGFLHLGHAYAALIAWHRARQVNGRFLLRIEDIDPARCRPEFTEAIIADLCWLGLDWDELRVQTDHLSDYSTAIQSLVARDLLYPCFCTRAETLREIERAASAPHAPDGSLRYPGTCRHIAPRERAARIARGVPYALRLDMTRALDTISAPLTYTEESEGTVICHPDRFGDVVLARKDAPASYHLCVTHDDAAQGVTLVTRADDLRPATDVQRLLQALMGWPAPRYAHHRLLTGADGRRLSKRDRATTLRALRAQGESPEQVRAMALQEPGRPGCVTHPDCRAIAMDTDQPTNANPGDEAPPGTPGTGEDVCPKCHGTGTVHGARCDNCGGSGKIVRGIGGA